MRIRATFLGLLVLLMTAPANAAVLYSQPFDGTNFFASQNDTSVGGLGNFATMYDNFTLGSAASISSINFTGDYGEAVQSYSMSGFTLTFYDNNSGQPGSSIYSQFTSGTANQTLLSPNIFTYAINLTTPFAAAGGTTYWVSLVPDLALTLQWYWGGGSGGDGISYQDFSGVPRRKEPNDLAFTLNDTPISNVPEPITLSLFGAGLAGAVAMRRRKKAA